MDKIRYYLVPDEALEVIKAGVDTTASEENILRHALFNYERLFEIHRWYEYVKDITYRTEFVKLSKEEIKSYLDLAKKSNYCCITDDDISNIKDESVSEFRQQLVKKISDAISENFEGRGVIIKSPSVSAKDVPPKKPTKDQLALFSKTLEEDIQDLPNISAKADDVISIYSRVVTMSLKATEGDGAVYLLENSTRVKTDFTKILEFLGEEGEEEFYLALREFDDRVPHNPGNEFRGFVFEGKLVAITQYNTFRKFDDDGEEYKKAIVSFFEEQVRPRLEEKFGQSSYILDFYCEGGEVTLVEINPFFKLMSPCNFDWDEDYEILMGEKFDELGTVMRVTPDRSEEYKDPLDKLLRLVPMKWANEVIKLEEEHKVQNGEEDAGESPSNDTPDEKKEKGGCSMF